MESGSQIFLPYKSIGYVSSGVPFQLRAEKLHYSIMLSIGNSFQLLNSIKLLPRMISNSQEGKIRDMLFYKKDQFLTTCKKDIILWKGQNEEFRFKGHSSNVEKIMLFDNILFSLGKNNELIMWDANTRLCFKEQLPEFDSKTHKITQLIHPLGYFNKILIGFESGELQLWNIKTKKMIYSFTAWINQHGDKNSGNESRSKVTAFQQSPVSDIVAIGFNDGRVVIHNLKLDKTVLTYQQRGFVTSISFRSDGQKQHVASSSSNGQVVIWDLEKNKAFHYLDNAHFAQCTKVEFLRDEPIIVTTGKDNAIKMWQFNGVDGIPILLRERTGHLDPPKSTEFFGDEANSLVSISEKSMRYVSIAAFTINKEMSKKKLKKEIKPFLAFSSNFRKNRSWETAISIHSDSKKAFSWDCMESTVKKQFNIKAPISSVKVSTCGNFAFFGTVFGLLYKYNIQSGLKRGKIEKGIQKSSITSIIVEPTNQYVITSGLDSIINYWDFTTLKLLHSIDISAGNGNGNGSGNKKIRISKMKLHSDSGIFAVVSNDDYIRLYDIDTRNLVRQFLIKGNVNDLVFSHDARWLIASTEQDSLIRVFDIPSGKMIDWFRMPHPITSLSFSPNGEYLVTTHTGQLPIYLWSNQSHFGSIFLKTPPEEPNTIILPTQVIEVEPSSSTSSSSTKNNNNNKNKKVKKEEEEEQEEFEIQEDLGVPELDDDQDSDEEMEDNEEDDDDDDESSKSKIKQIGNLITLSQDIAKSKWQSLINLDTIKERNKPILQKEKPVLAPFFLSTIEGLEPKFAKVDIVNPLNKAPSIANIGSSTNQNDNEESEPTEEEIKGWDNWAGADDNEEDDEDDDEEDDDEEQLFDEDGNPIDPEDVMEDDEIEELEKTKTFRKKQFRSDKVIRTDSLQGSRTKFNLSLEQGYRTQNYSNSLKILKSLTPSGIDFEIRTLTSTDDYADVHYMFDFVVYQLKKNGDYDFIQSILNVALKVHGYLLYTTSFKRDLRSLLISFNEPWLKMQKLFHSDIFYNNKSSGEQINEKYRYLYELDKLVYNFTEGNSKNRGYCRRNDIILKKKKNNIGIINATSKINNSTINSKNNSNNKNKNTINEDTKIIDNFKKLSFKQKKESIYFKYQTTVYGKNKNTKDAFECKTLNGDKIKYVVLEPAYKGQEPVLDIYFDTYSDISNSIPNKVPSPDIPRVLYAFEPPHLRYCSEVLQCIDKFNWTISYDENSDLRLGFDRVDSTPFQTYQSITNTIIMKNKMKFKKEYEEKKRSNKLLPHQLEKGIPIASWFCSNCNETFTTRTEIVRDLIELVSIDSYGACLNNIPIEDKLSRLKVDAFFQKKQIISKYKFYLAFENSNCLDYITEKSLHALEVGTVPIYLGHPQTLKYLPRGSYIYIGDFNTTRQLAEYLKFLDENDNEYLKYHQWRQNQTIIDEWKFQNQYPFKPASNKLMCSLMRKYEQWSTGKIIENRLNSTYPRSKYCLDPYYYDHMLIKSVKPTDPPIESSPKTIYYGKYSNANYYYDDDDDDEGDDDFYYDDNSDSNDNYNDESSSSSSIKKISNISKNNSNNSIDFKLYNEINENVIIYKDSNNNNKDKKGYYKYNFDNYKSYKVKGEVKYSRPITEVLNELNSSKIPYFIEFKTKYNGEIPNRSLSFRCRSIYANSDDGGDKDENNFEYVSYYPTNEINQNPIVSIYSDTMYDINYALLDHLKDDIEKYRQHNIKSMPIRVLLAMEPPHLRFCSFNKECIKLFNWTVDYEETSDIKLGFYTATESPFEDYSRKSIDSIKLDKLNFIQLYNEKKKNQTLEPHQEFGIPIASWFCSNCDTVNSIRESYVLELMKYIVIDSFGDCAKNMPTQSNLNRRSGDPFASKKRVISKYKFNLVFENSNCLDYITEKIFHALEVGTVPIFMGHPQTLRYLPKSSFIFVGDFNSAKQLAQYLIYLNENDDEYLKYHQWRNDKTIIDNWKKVNNFPNKPSFSTFICPLFRQYQHLQNGTFPIQSRKFKEFNSVCLPQDYFKI